MATHNRRLDMRNKKISVCLVERHPGAVRHTHIRTRRVWDPTSAVGYCREHTVVLQRHRGEKGHALEVRAGGGDD